VEQDNIGLAFSNVDRARQVVVARAIRDIGVFGLACVYDFAMAKIRQEAILLVPYDRIPN